MTPRLLSIAGSDSGGGAGIQADVKTASALGVYASTAITAVTAQNTQGVKDVHVLPSEIVKRQIVCVLSDIGADAIKLGMLANVEICQAVYSAISNVSVPIVLDPVMVSTSGHTLLDGAAINVLKDLLMPLSAVVTPNLPEFDLLFHLSKPSENERLEAAKGYVEAHGLALLLKGGHGIGDFVIDRLITTEGVHNFQSKRLDTKHTHGTGCTLSAAIASLLAKGVCTAEAVEQAVQFVQRAIENAPGLGHGNGPLSFLENNKKQ